MMKKTIATFVLLITSVLCLWGCTLETETSQPTTISTSTTVESVATTTTTTASRTTTTSTATTTTTTTETTTTIVIETTAPSFSLSDVPEYSGNPYVEVNGNVPFFTEFPDQPFELYSPLDELGRCGVAYANISIDIMPTEKRGEIGSVKPSGWHTANYSGILDDIYLYNRCHLIGYQLAGENANELNLITGTRYMNIEGMEPFENRVANYVKSFNAHVLYRVTPVFDGSNLVASGVLMEAYSLDDAGAGIQYCVFCYNVQPGICINYADGESWIAEQQTEPPQPELENEIPVEDNSTTYVLNTNTKKFHFPSCSSVRDMKDKNKQEYTGSRDEIIAMGYDPCKRCNP